VSELLFRSAAELAALVRSGELSATELVTESLRRIDDLQPTVNAFTFVAHDAALDAAAGVGAGDPRPFAGVPIAIKDNRPIAGMPLTMGSDLFGDFVPRHDAYLVRRLRAAGFVIVGKTALPEMGILPTSEPRRSGPVHNPWALQRTAGGSSGGSAAAVAAGMVPIAHGNDGGGSIRIPAACCGLVGLKPARGRVSIGPDSGHSFLVADGVLTRSVADTAQALDVLAGYELGDATWAPPPGCADGVGRALGGGLGRELGGSPGGRLVGGVESWFGSASESDPGPQRIALLLAPALAGAELDPECERAARAGAALLESLGHVVEEIPSPWPEGDLLPDFTRAFGPLVSTTTLMGARISGREPREEDVEPLTWELWQRARAEDTISFLDVQNRLERVGRQLVTAWSRYDAVLTPALAQRPVPLGAIHGRGPDPWDHFRRSGYFTPYTAVVNVSGLPAIALPLFHGADGLPSAIQLIGRPVGEAALLSLAGQLERALPWAGRRPAVVGG
jgi:amidase